MISTVAYLQAVQQTGVPDLKRTLGDNKKIQVHSDQHNFLKRCVNSGIAVCSIVHALPLCLQAG